MKFGNWFIITSCLASFLYNSTCAIVVDPYETRKAVIIEDSSVDTDLSLNMVQCLSNGKIIGCGTQGNNLIIVRYTSDNKRDETFGVDGKVAAPIGAELVASSFVIDDTGRIIVATTLSSAGRNKIILLAYEIDGQPCRTFGKDGIALIDFWNQSFAQHVLIDSDQRIIVIGFLSNGLHDEGIALAVDSRGRLDDSFANKGVLRLPYSFDSRWSTGAIDAKQRFLIGGYRSDGVRNNMMLLACDKNGRLDNSFGENGIITTTFFGHSEITSLSVDIQGNIIGAGFFNDGKKSNFTLARYNTLGTLDESFGNQGILTATGHQFSMALALTQHSGSIFSGGLFNDGNLNRGVLIISDSENKCSSLNFLDTLDNILIIPKMSSIHINVIARDGKSIIIGGYFNKKSQEKFLLFEYCLEYTMDDISCCIDNITLDTKKNDFILMEDLSFDIDKLAIVPTKKIVLNDPLVIALSEKYFGIV